jgi:predicted XRE-type DNA-binding protein
VLALIAGGYNNMEIARALGAAEGTIKNHVSNIISKLGARDRVQAVFKGIDMGLLWNLGFNFEFMQWLYVSGAKWWLCKTARLVDVVYALHAFQKTYQATAKWNTEIARKHHTELMRDTQWTKQKLKPTLLTLFRMQLHIPEQAANLQACAELMRQIADIIKASEWKQSDAATYCGVTQPRINDLLRGRILRFSLDALVNIATPLGRRVHVELDVA